MKKRKIIFGPVISRRLGRSLGVDLIPYKTCSLDCIYCECGKTNFLETKRVEYFKVDEVLKEINSFIKESGEVDFITFAGSGEPTLFYGLKEIIERVKRNYPNIKVALITNSTLLSLKEVRDDLKNIDVIIPSLDAISEDIFKKINRPHIGITSKMVISGLLEFKKEFNGEMWLELFIIPGINDSLAELNKFSEVLQILKPEKLQLNSLDRPGTERWVKSATLDQLDRVKNILDIENTEIISKSRNQKEQIKDSSVDKLEVILQILKRRPCTINDLISGTGMKSFEVNKILRELEEKEIVSCKEEERGIFFCYNKNFNYS